jgi:hypothetical protein
MSYANKGCRTHALLRHLVGAILFVEDFVVDVVPVAGEGLLDGVEAAVPPLMGSAAIFILWSEFCFRVYRGQSADGRSCQLCYSSAIVRWPEPPLPATPRGYPGNVGNTGIPGLGIPFRINSGHFGQIETRIFVQERTSSVLQRTTDTGTPVASFFYFELFERSNGWTPTSPIRS